MLVLLVHLWDSFEGEMNDELLRSVVCTSVSDGG